MMHRDPLEGLFGTDSGTPAAELDSLTLGYEDLSGGRATELLLSLPEATVKAIHRYTFDGPTDVIGHVSALSGLLEGLDERDPSRSSAEAVELARGEIAGVRGFFVAVIQHDELPFIGRMRSPDDPSPDAAKIGWGVVDTTEDGNDALTYARLIDVMESYLVDPVTGKADYDKAMLAFMNDVIFRPGIVVRR